MHSSEPDNDNGPHGAQHAPLRIASVADFTATYRQLVATPGLECSRSPALEIVLALLGAGRLCLGTAELAEAVHAPEPTVRRWLDALVDKGVIERHAGLAGVCYSLAGAVVGRFSFEI